MSNKSIAQIGTGLLVLVLGLGLLLDALNIIDFYDVMKGWWPLIIMGIGVISVLSNPRQWVWPVLIIIFGGALLLKQLGVINVNVWGLIWPVIIIFVGLSIMLRKRTWDDTVEKEDDAFNATAVFSGQNVRVVSQKFKGGEITAVFGGVELDLHDAKMQGSAVVDIFAAFGGAEIKVPDGWAIRVSGMPVFGGWEDKTRKPADVKNAPLLRINGTCIFGGVSIKND